MRLYARSEIAAWRLPIRAFVDGAIPSWIAPSIAGAVVFSRAGLDPHDLSRWMETSLPVRCALWGAWLSLTRPASAALLSPPGSTWVRSAPIATIYPILATGAVSLLLHAPWAILFAAGGRGLGALAAAALAACLSLPLRGRAAVTFLLGGALVMAAAPAWLALPLAMAGLGIGLPSAWRRAPEPSALTSLPMPRLPVAATWAYACVLHTCRAERGRLLRLASGLAIAVLLFALWNANVPAPDATSAAVRNATLVGVGSVVVTATLLPAVARFRDTCAWLVASTGHGRGGRLVVLPLAILPLALAGTVAAAISAAGLPWCLVVAMAAVLFVSAWEAKDGGSSVVRAVLLAGGLAVAVGVAGAWLPYVAAGAALAAAAVFWRRTR